MCSFSVSEINVSEITKPMNNPNKNTGITIMVNFIGFDI